MTNGYVLSKLRILEEIARNPNLKNGVWNSFEEFITVSDEILDRVEHDCYIGCLIMSSEIHATLKGIRVSFEKISGIKLGENEFGKAYLKAKAHPRNHLLKMKLSKLLKGYRGCFIRWESED